VHGSIKICPLAKELIDTRHVQRLRELKQLGVSDLTYINATHTRFEHSLGVMYLAEKMLLNLIDKRQAVEISPKDVLCVKIAGLLHDIGHGPYSHVYDGLFRTQLGRAEARGSWMGHAFERGSSSDEVMEGWAHEDASLMMIDSMLEDLGMQIDETNLDKPLRQIGDGIDARRFGVGECWVDGDDGISDRSDEEDEERHDGPALSKDEVMTSRDWIFIKECVVGGPLPPRGVSIHEFKRSAAGRRAQFIGRDQHLKEFHLKEFLYDVVSNRHSGLDVDKIDYLARDTLKAHGSNCIADLMPKLIVKAFVAWGEPCEDGGEKHLMM
jgi:HD superfamily phosphohydrolase